MKVIEILCSFKLVLEGKPGKEIPESSRSEFLEKFSANNFALSDAEDKTLWLLNWGGIADLPLLRTTLAIHQKSWEPSFWEVMESCFRAKMPYGTSRSKFSIKIYVTNIEEHYLIVIFQPSIAT